MLDSNGGSIVTPRLHSSLPSVFTLRYSGPTADYRGRPNRLVPAGMEQASAVWNMNWIGPGRNWNWSGIGIVNGIRNRSGTWNWNGVWIGNGVMVEGSGTTAVTVAATVTVGGRGW